MKGRMKHIYNRIESYESFWYSITVGGDDYIVPIFVD